MNNSTVNEIKLSEIKDGATFKVGNTSFIKFFEKDGATAAVTKDTIFKSAFGNNNDFSKSKILEELKNDFLPKIENAVGKENVIEFETDLTTLDGLKPYGTLKSKIGLPTFDFYRANVNVFDKYKIDSWWWLATADSAKPHCNPDWVVCVSPYGNFYNGSSNDGNCGVRPFLFFESSIKVRHF